MKAGKTCEGLEEIGFAVIVCDVDVREDVVLPAVAIFRCCSSCKVRWKRKLSLSGYLSVVFSGSRIQSRDMTMFLFGQSRE